MAFFDKRTLTNFPHYITFITRADVRLLKPTLIILKLKSELFDYVVIHENCFT